MKKIFILLVLSTFLMGCATRPEAIESGTRVRLKGTNLVGTVAYDCGSDWCEVSYSHGKINAPAHQLEKIDE